MLECMFGLSITTTAIVLTIVLVVVALAYISFGWLRKRSWRVMLRGIGFILMPVGLLAMGLMAKFVNGVQSIIDWATSTVMNAWIMIGLVAIGIGLLAFLVGSFVPPVSAADAAERREAIKAKKLALLQVEAGKPGAPAAAPASPASAKPAPAAGPAPKAAPATEDDKEVDDILKRHGIN